MGALLVILAVLISGAAPPPTDDALPCLGSRAFGLTLGKPAKSSDVRLAKLYRVHPDAPLLAIVDTVASPWPPYSTIEGVHTPRSGVLWKASGYVKFETQARATAFYEALLARYSAAAGGKAWTPDDSYASGYAPPGHYLQFGAQYLSISRHGPEVFLLCELVDSGPQALKELLEAE